MTMTDEEFQAQLDLADARLDIANGKQITPERYREVIQSLIAGRESRARAIVEAGKTRSRARREAKPKPQPLDPAFFFGPATCEDDDKSISLKMDTGEEAVPSS